MSILNKHHVIEFARIVDELDIPVMAFGLKNDFRNELFEGSKYLLLYADKLEELKRFAGSVIKSNYELALLMANPFMKGSSPNWWE